MITIDLPWVLWAFSANWRTTAINCARGVPLMRSCHAGVVKILGREFAGQAAGHPVVRHLQVEHGGDQRVAAAERDALHGHGADQHIAVFAFQYVIGKVDALDAAEIRETDFRVIAARISAFEHRQPEFHVAAVLGFLRLEVPLPLVRTTVSTPAETNRAIR
jgi:hypothetical protein